MKRVSSIKIMLSINDLKKGTVIQINNEPYEILETQHSKMGRAGAVLRTKIKNLATGNVLDKTYKGGDKFEEADLEELKAQFLYREGESFYFMDQESYDQFSLNKSQLNDKANYLAEEIIVKIKKYRGNPIRITLPPEVKLKVADAPPGIKGNTADGGSKIVTLETGLKIAVPLHIKEGDVLRIKTETGRYDGKE